MGQGLFKHKPKQDYVKYKGQNYKLFQTTNHSISITGVPNSVCRKCNKNGNIEMERYYDRKGNPLVDIDYTDHGNPKRHPKVPHIHKWNNSDPGHPRREN